MSSDYKYYRLEDLYCIHIGSGRSAWQKWGVMDHEGPIIRLDYLGYPQKHYAYLPLSLLTALYQRFAQSSQSELRLGDFDDMDDIAIERYGDEQSMLLYDERKILATINHERGDEGYPLLTPYLPELLDPDIINRIAVDPWLDRRLLTEAEELGLGGGGIYDRLWRDRSARWSKEWRKYCDGVMQTNRAYKSFE